MANKNVSRETQSELVTAVNNDSRNNDIWDLLKKEFGKDMSDIDSVQLYARRDFYRTELLNIAKGRFEVTCPDWWDVDYILDLLLTLGRFFITDSPIGICPFNGSPFGLNVFLRPYKVTITNPVVPTFDRTLVHAVDYMPTDPAVCVYLYDNKWYHTINPALDMYSMRLAMIDESIDINLFNTKVPYIFNVDDNKQAETAKEMYRQIAVGKPAVFVRNNQKPLSATAETGALVETMPVKDIYVADKMQELKRIVVGEFLTKIGINNVAYEKRERLITSEVDNNEEEIECNIEYIKRNLEESNKLVRDVFGLEYSIKIKEGVKNEEQEQVQQDLHQEDNA